MDVQVSERRWKSLISSETCPIYLSSSLLLLLLHPPFKELSNINSYRFQSISICLFNYSIAIYIYIYNFYLIHNQAFLQIPPLSFLSGYQHRTSASSSSDSLPEHILLSSNITFGFGFKGLINQITTSTTHSLPAIHHLIVFRFAVSHLGTCDSISPCRNYSLQSSGQSLNHHLIHEPSALFFNNPLFLFDKFASANILRILYRTLHSLKSKSKDDTDTTST